MLLGVNAFSSHFDKLFPFHLLLLSPFISFSSPFVNLFGAGDLFIIYRDLKIPIEIRD